MYGLVNTAIRDLVVKEHGEDVWLKVLSHVDYSWSTFVAMQSYPDSLTYDLVAAACQELGASAEALLEAFGDYWITFIAEQGYGTVMDFAGGSLEEFLENLDDMHARLSMSFPELCPPSFVLERSEDESLVLHYYSERKGLAPMVIGLLKGLARRFDRQIEVDHLPPNVTDSDHDRFLIRVRQPVRARHD